MKSPDLYKMMNLTESEHVTFHSFWACRFIFTTRKQPTYPVCLLESKTSYIKRRCTGKRKRAIQHGEAFMKILAINGSHRVGQNTAKLLTIALEEAQALGAETELVELAELDIEYCVGCNKCLMKPQCTIEDDMKELKAKMAAADGIILGSPDYFSNVTARMKCFIDRTRPLHMVSNQLKGKVGGYLTMSGLDNCGSEATNHVMDHFFATHEMMVVHPRPEGPVIGSGVTGSLMAGMKEGKPRWRRSVDEDEIALAIAHQLGKDMVYYIEKLA